MAGLPRPSDAIFEKKSRPIPQNRTCDLVLQNIHTDHSATTEWPDIVRLQLTKMLLKQLYFILRFDKFHAQ